MNEAVSEIKLKVSEKEKGQKIYTGEIRPGGLKGKSGPIGLVNSVGLGREINEDVVAVNLKQNAFAVIDGMGGYAGGKEAAVILAEELQKGFAGEIDMSNVQSSASQRMRGEGIKNGGACYISGMIEGRNLNIYQAGDVRLVVFDKSGEAVFQTEDENMGKLNSSSVVLNAVSGRDAGKTSTEKVQLDKGDMIIVGSDGLWDNFNPQEVSRVISTSNGPYEVVEKLKRYVLARMKKGKKDNLSILAYEIKDLSNFEAGQEKTVSNFQKAQNWQDLYRIIESLGGLQGSEDYYSAEDLKERVSEVRRGNLPVSVLTRKAGLRKAVIRLAEQ